MFVRIKREHYDDYGKVTEGHVIEVDDDKGKDLIRSGLAENIQEAAPQGTGGPTSSAASNVSTGATAPLSSSLAAQAPQPSISAPPAGEAASSVSTTGTGSADGGTLFTDATGHGGKHKRGPRRSKA